MCKIAVKWSVNDNGSFVLDLADFDLTKRDWDNADEEERLEFLTDSGMISVISDLIQNIELSYEVIDD